MSALNVQGIGMTSQRTRDRLIARLGDEGIASFKVLEVMRRAPRHLFMDEALASHAYEDTALPIGHGQTISQPFVVARMTELLLESHPARVLEIGTGSGYQCYVLSQLVEQVFSVERLMPLHQQASRLIRDLGVSNVRFKHTDGGWGWPENGPFDAIMVTAAASSVPQALRDQLSPGGRMVIPVGAGDAQELRVIDHLEPGRFSERTVELVRFVPLVTGAR
ncbi:MAG: protein-L-isoaspartate(D-aspartate) O-methyltransferase [Gammaproteobacteria bacterium]|nr:protein-L-isoaspartate(D-aspartate) O-methyltransferase [Gammaproteobacteria bacterium]MCP5137292.1 protein-L-isoaspartate(D-aspartate) O-methyltransferase [Gammaproteobacteria bacterium]